MKQANLKQKRGRQVVINALMLAAMFVISIEIQAQVTIGSGEPPVSGASLQVKEIPNVSGGNANSYRGINFPRVSLTDLNRLYPMFLSDPKDLNSGSSTEYINNKASIDKEHIGLTVYNIGSQNIKSGIYYWDGTKWEQISLPSNSTGGAMYESFRVVEGLYTINAPYVVQDNDYLLFLRFTGSGTNGTAIPSTDGYGNTSSIAQNPPYINSKANLILPDPTTCKGRVLRLINDTYTMNKPVYVYTNYPMFCMNGESHFYNASPYNMVHERDYQVAASSPIDGSRWCIFSDGANWISMEVVIY